MEVKDVFIAPIFLLLLYVLANYLRSRLTSPQDRRYFMPAFWAKIGGGFAFQIIHIAFYQWGDTFNYFRHARWIVRTFWNSPGNGLALWMHVDTYQYELQNIIDMMWWYDSPAEYTVVRVAALAGVVTFDCYTCQTFVFGFLSFLGSWSMFRTMCRIYPQLMPKLAISVLFIPSVVFWGSGLLKDPLCLSALGFLFTAFYDGLILRQRVTRAAIMGFAAAWMLFTIKRYILFSFVPPAMIWVFMANGARIRNRLARKVLLPILTIAGCLVAVFVTSQLTENDSHYSIDKVGERTKITADYILRMSEKDKGSGYSLGELDGSIGSMVRLAPQAVNVALFRPYLWEVHSPIMLLSAIESLFFLIFTLRLFLRNGLIRTFRLAAGSPLATFCFGFALFFAFAVGIASNNFGTLARYKIPLMPFFLVGLYVVQYEAERARHEALRRFAIA